jgi:hypothetical protein
LLVEKLLIVKIQAVSPSRPMICYVARWNPLNHIATDTNIHIANKAGIAAKIPRKTLPFKCSCLDHKEILLHNNANTETRTTKADGITKIEGSTPADSVKIDEMPIYRNGKTKIPAIAAAIRGKKKLKPETNPKSSNGRNKSPNAKKPNPAATPINVATTR